MGTGQLFGQPGELVTSCYTNQEKLQLHKPLALRVDLTYLSSVYRYDFMRFSGFTDL